MKVPKREVEGDEVINLAVAVFGYVKKAYVRYFKKRKVTLSF